MTIDAAPNAAFCASTGRWRAWRPARHSRATVARARGNPGRTRREDPPPLLADLDCAVRGSDPFLRVCPGPLSQSVHPVTGPRATDQRPRAQDLRPGGVGSTAEVARPLRHALWSAPSATLIFAVHGFRCLRTEIAEHPGAGRGSVTGIYLPGWFARNPPAIHAPLLLHAAFLYGRNIRRTGMCANAGHAGS